MTDKITIEHHVLDQNRIRFWGVPCGYCGTRPGMPVNFFAGRMDTLSTQEKAEVIAYVIEHVGAVKRTAQTREAFRVFDHRTDTGSE